MKENIPVIAFDGINRVGKGTQINKIKNVLVEVGISFIELRGDGTRDGLGKEEGDPLDFWWQENSKRIRAEGTTEDWHYAAYKLMVELSQWREKARLLNKKIILLDRSLISRASFILDREMNQFGTLEINNLYPVQEERKLKIEDILPDVIFELFAQKEILINRLDKKEPKYGFRLNIIENCYENYYKAKESLSSFIKERIIRIDSSMPIDVVFDNLMEIINTKITLFRKE